MEEKKVRRGGIVGPLFLVGLGVMILLNNLGYVDWSIWATLWRIWPIFLIAAGLDLLIGRRSALGSLLVLALIVGVFAVGIWLAWQPVAGTPVESEALTLPLPGITQAQVQIGRAAGALEIGPLSSTTHLVEGTLGLRRGETALQEWEVRDGTAYFHLRNKGNTTTPQVGGRRDQWLWSIQLNERVPMALEVSGAAGQVHLDLERLMLDDLQMSLAVGQGTVILPRDGSLKAKISGAIGQVEVVIPRSQEARITFSTALVAREVPSAFRQEGDAWVTPGYATAESRIDLEIGLVMGSVNVRYLD